MSSPANAPGTNNLAKGSDMKSKNLGLLAAGIVLAAATTVALAGAPQAVTITTKVVFGQPTGTFEVVTGPICPSAKAGTLHRDSQTVAGGGPTLLVNSVYEFTCYDNSGTFFIRLHPQFNGRKTEFNLAGPWSIWGKGTGDYAEMSGYGEFGVVTYDISGTDPVQRGGDETYVGFVNL
jgi:hypothetical protein